MSLCRSSRCGCTLTSSTLQITGKTGGVGYNLETYEGIATEDPDTRPAPGERFEGMRVWTTDTKRLFVWNDTDAEWEILSEPPQRDLTSADFDVWQSAGATSIAHTLERHWYQRQRKAFALTVALRINGSGTDLNNIIMELPSVFQWPTAADVHGPAQWYDASTNTVYPGNVRANGVGTQVNFFLGDDTATLAANTPAVASGDALEFSVTGVLS